MKKLFPIIPILAICIFLGSCKKNSVEEKYTETVQPALPDLSTQIYASVEGFITDESGNAVEGALVKGGTITTVTDAYGYFRISNTAFAKSAGFVQVNKAGYFSGTRTFLPKETAQSFVRLQLVPKIIDGSFDAGTGGTVTIAGGGTVSIPSNGVVLASNNNSYSGTVNLSAHWLNPADMDITRKTMPGDLRGINSAGYLNILTTFGMLVVELSNPAGELLQVAPGHKAALKFPLPSSIAASAPASIPLWYFDENNGLWKEDGAAIKNGDAYEGEVSHFTWWNCDGPSSVVNFVMQLVTMDLKPLAYLDVLISKADNLSASFFVYSDSSGYINCMLPANSDVVLNISTTCSPDIFHRNVSTATNNIDLGTIKLDGQQYSADFTGTVNNCSSQPVTNGYVIIAAGGQNQVQEINNGNFHLSTLVCTGTTATVVAFDRDASQNSVALNSTLTTGINDFGTIQACNASPVEMVTYSIDGAPVTTLTEPFYLLTGSFNFSTSVTNINAFDQVSSTSTFNMNFLGLDITGNHTVSGPISINNQTYTASTMVSVTAYGLIGEFITGTYNGTITDTGGVDHLLVCTFSVKRET